MPTKFSTKIKKFLKLPYFSDLVEENVKHRGVYPLVIFSIYIILVFVILSAVSNVKTFEFFRKIIV